MGTMVDCTVDPGPSTTLPLGLESLSPTNEIRRREQSGPPDNAKNLCVHAEIVAWVRTHLIVWQADQTLDDEYRLIQIACVAAASDAARTKSHPVCANVIRNGCANNDSIPLKCLRGWSTLWR